MPRLNSFQRKLEPFSVSHLTLYLVIAQTIVYLAELLGYADIGQWILVPELVKHGEYWRLATFVAIPPITQWYWFAFAIYFLYFAGTALESYWGAVRYNLFLLSGYVLTVGTAFFFPLSPVSNFFIGQSIFLAFAYLNPDFEILIFFILPIRIKWLALANWILTGYFFVRGSWSLRVAIIASLGNFFLFFFRELWLDVCS